MQTPETGSQKPRARKVRATVVFADLLGFTAMSEQLDAEHAYAVTTGCLKLLDGIARKHGGSVDKYLGDSLMVVFGYPVPMEHPERAAVDAAMEMRERVYGYNRELELEVPLDVHIGINTGDVIGGDIRGPVVREFHVLGNSVNVAARLKAKAPAGSIYVGEETWGATRERFEFRELEPLALKGKSVRLATYEAISSLDRGWDRELGAEEMVFSELVGREDEFDRLRRALADLAGGCGGIVTLTGGEGAGKTRLLLELGRDSATNGIETIEVRPLERSDPAMPATDAVAEAVSQAEEVIDSGLPLLFAFEDLQRAENASLRLLEGLLPVAAERPLLILLTARPRASELARVVASARELGVPIHDEIALGPLRESESRRLIEALVGVDGLPDSQRALVEARADGNPGRIILGAYLAPALASESEQVGDRAQRGDEAERRRATILFSDITGFTAMTEKLGPERAYPIVADCLAILDATARKHGGTVDKYMGDCVMSLFGVPEAIEDAPRAAVNAAIDMRRQLRKYNETNDLPMPLEVHTGIHTGLGIAGDISGPLLREFAVMGDSVNVASELCDLAEAGQVYVGHETHRFTRDRFEFEELRAVRLPGQAEAVQVYELLSETTQIYRRSSDSAREIFSELVGRAAEMKALRERVENLSRGAGGIVSVIAEAGLGKSRLMDELRGSPEAEGSRWMEGRSLSIGQGLSFHPFGDLLRTWAGISDEDQEEQLPSRVEEATRDLFGEESDESAPLLATLMGIRLPAHMQERVDAIPDEMVERVLHANFTRFLQRLSDGQPLVLVFDDLHWADGSSIELLQKLLRLAASHPILFVLVFRPGFTETSDRILASAQTEHEERHQEIVLQPLEEEAARELVNNLFRRAEIPHRVRTLIVERAQGNPFYFEEVVRSLVEEGAIEPVDNGFRATQKIHEVVIPGTVQEVIMARVDRLAPAAKQALQVASVIGRSFHYEVLLQLLLEKEETRQTVDHLVEAQFLLPWDRLQGEEYAFKHPLIQEVTYDSLIRTRREVLHLRVGDAIESVLTENVPGFHAMLAYHFSLGRDVERAEESLFRAGDEAARSAASNEALHFFQQASKLYFEMHGDGGDPRKKATLERNMGLATYNRGLVGDAIEHFDAALGHMGESVTKNPMRLNLRFARDMVAILAGLYAPLPARRRPEATADQLEIIDTMYRRAESQTTADPTRFVFDAMAALRKLSKVDPKTVPAASEIYAKAVGIFSYSGISFALSRRFLGLAHELAGGRSRAEQPLWYRFVSWVHYFLEGDWSPEREIEEALLQGGLRDGHLWEVDSYLGMSADQALRKGEFAKARAKMEANDKIWELYQYEPAKITHYAAPFMLGLEERRLPETIQACDIYNQESPQELLHLFSLGYKASAQLLEGAREDAEVSLERSARIVEEVGSAIPYHLSGYRVARLHADLIDLEAAWASGDRREQERLWKKSRASSRFALRIVSKLSYRGPEVFRLVGRRAWLAGHRSEATRLWGRGLAAARSLGMRPEVARLFHEVGFRLAETSKAPLEFEGRKPAECTEDARGLFTELGLSWDLARLEDSRSP